MKSSSERCLIRGWETVWPVTTANIVTKMLIGNTRTQLMMMRIVWQRKSIDLILENNTIIVIILRVSSYDNKFSVVVVTSTVSDEGWLVVMRKVTRLDESWPLTSAQDNGRESSEFVTLGSRYQRSVRLPPTITLLTLATNHWDNKSSGRKTWFKYVQ